MRRSMTLRTVLSVLAAVALANTPALAQWFKYPTPGAPRTKDGKVNLSAPAPKMADGKPDFSGIWITANPACPGGVNPETHTCGVELPMGRHGIDIGADVPGGLPVQPWLAAKVKERIGNDAKDDPHVRCFPDTFLRAYSMPHLIKFVQVSNLLVVLNEMNGLYRQVFIDGRPLPKEVNLPSWQGYSVARWEGDALVIDTVGFRDGLWLDWHGNELSSQAKVRERITRPDYGHLDVEVTVDDPKSYTKPWTTKLREIIATDTELVDEICLENEQSAQRMR